jgi:acetyl esterase/lipase
MLPTVFNLNGSTLTPAEAADVVLPWLSVHTSPVAAGQAPAFLVLPGGGYQRHAEHEGEGLTAWLNALGIHAFVLRYRVGPTPAGLFPGPLADAKAAMAWIRSGAHGIEIDPERVGVIGSSAGGHLAATLSLDLPSQDTGLDAAHTVPDLAVLSYPVISMVHEPHHGSVERLLGDQAAAEVLESLSAELQVTDSAPPTFIWHTGDDANVPVSNSLNYAAALLKRQVATELHVFPAGAHGLGLADENPSVRQWAGLCERWLHGHGWL